MKKLAKTINSTCIVEENKPNKVYYLSDNINEGARLYGGKSFSELNIDFNTCDFDDFTNTSLFEINETISMCFDNGKITDAFYAFVKKQDQKIDAELIKKCIKLIESIPKIYDTPFEWEGIWLDEGDGDFIEIDQENKTFIFSLMSEGKSYLLIVAENDRLEEKVMANYEHEGDTYEFGECEGISTSIRIDIAKELEIEAECINDDDLYIYLDYGLDTYFFVSDEQREIITKTYIKKFEIVRELLDKLMPDSKQVINKMIFLSSYDYLLQ